jgi:hypothetical protein
MIHATITAIDTDAEYGGQVYTQSVTIEVADGTALTIFDGTPVRASHRDIGNEVKCEIVVHATSLQEAADTGKGRCVIQRDGK